MQGFGEHFFYFPDPCINCTGGTSLLYYLPLALRHSNPWLAKAKYASVEVPTTTITNHKTKNIMAGHSPSSKELSNTIIPNYLLLWGNGQVTNVISLDGVALTFFESNYKRRKYLRTWYVREECMEKASGILNFRKAYFL